MKLLLLIIAVYAALAAGQAALCDTAQLATIVSACQQACNPVDEYATSVHQCAGTDQSPCSVALQGCACAVRVAQQPRNNTYKDILKTCNGAAACTSQQIAALYSGCADTVCEESTNEPLTSCAGFFTQQPQCQQAVRNCSCAMTLAAVTFFESVVELCKPRPPPLTSAPTPAPTPVPPPTPPPPPSPPPSCADPQRLQSFQHSCGAAVAKACGFASATDLLDCLVGGNSTLNQGCEVTLSDLTDHGCPCPQALAHNSSYATIEAVCFGAALGPTPAPTPSSATTAPPTTVTTAPPTTATTSPSTTATTSPQTTATTTPPTTPPSTTASKTTAATTTKSTTATRSVPTPRPSNHTRVCGFCDFECRDRQDLSLARSGCFWLLFVIGLLVVAALIIIIVLCTRDPKSSSSESNDRYKRLREFSFVDDSKPTFSAGTARLRGQWRADKLN